MKKNKTLLSLAIIAIAFLGGCIIGYLNGVQHAAIQDFKTYQANLAVFDMKAKDAQFHEFLRARYYYFANRIPVSYVVGPHFYFGEVDTNIFNNMPLGKGPTTASREYTRFRERMAPYLGNQVETNSTH